MAEQRENLKNNISEFRNWLEGSKAYFDSRVLELSQTADSQKSKKKKATKSDKSSRSLEFYKNCSENLDKIDISLSHNIYVFRQCVWSPVPENRANQKRGRGNSAGGRH